MIENITPKHPINAPRDVNGLTKEGDYKLLELAVIPYTGNTAHKIDLSAVRVQINIFEDLFSNTMSGNVVLSENWDLHQLLPLIGQETLLVSFTRPKLNVVNTYAFRVYKSSERYVEKTRQHVYVLNFVSPEQIRNETTNVSRAFRQVPYSEMVRIMYSEHLSLGKPCTIEDTKSAQSFVCPYMSPLETINLWAARSLSSKHAGSAFVFYEDKDGFRFASIEELMSASPNNVTTLKWRPANIFTGGNEYRPRDIEDDLQNIVRIDYPHGFDVLRNVQRGMYGAKLITFNPVTEKVTTQEFKYKEAWGKLKHLEPNDVCTDALDALSGPSALHVRWSRSGTDALDAAVTDPRIEDYLMVRESQLQAIRSNVIRITVPGDPRKKVGQVYDLSVPDMTSYKHPDGSVDRYMSGRYLATSLRHRIEFSTYYCDIELIKDSFVHPIKYIDPEPLYKPTW